MRIAIAAVPMVFGFMSALYHVRDCLTGAPFGSGMWPPAALCLAPSLFAEKSHFTPFKNMLYPVNNPAFTPESAIPYERFPSSS